MAHRVLETELWSGGQRQGSKLHEVSYRACFKSALPAYFIERHTKRGDLVYDPFSGRGTTAIEAALSGRQVAANDVNPVSALIASPRLSVPDEGDLLARLAQIPKAGPSRGAPDLSMFFEQQTFDELLGLRHWLLSRRASGDLDAVDAWIGMVATSRLTGHSPGFFSVYSLPPNQAVSADRQRKINVRLKQTPEYRDTHALILKKSRQLVSDLTPQQQAGLAAARGTALFLTGDARHTPAIASDSVALTVTSPPFLDVVDYSGDNWLRGWFNGIDVAAVGKGISITRTVDQWSAVMADVFAELFRITRPGGVVAFEVGEVKHGKVKLDEAALPLGQKAGFVVEAVLINTGHFTKTANIWGIDNNVGGTNSNRIVLLRKRRRRVKKSVPN